MSAISATTVVASARVARSVPRPGTSSFAATSTSRAVSRPTPRTKRAPTRFVKCAATEEDENNGTSDESNTPRKVSRRGAILNAVYLAISIPLWRDVLHDLGYLQGDEDKPAELPVPPPGSGFETATFAGGCFWCMEKPFDILDGVIATTSGYTGPEGSLKNPTYHEVGAGGTGHREAVQILYDPTKVTYETLLDVYWHQIDPTNDDRMFLDTGLQYSSAIFPKDEGQRTAAEASLNDLRLRNVFPSEIKTQIINLDSFYPAEIYHQDYYRNNGLRYGFYRSLSGRDEFVQGVWGVSEWESYTGHNVK